MYFYRKISIFAHKWLRVLFTLPSSQITEEYCPPPFVSRALGHHHSSSQVCANCFILSLCSSHSSINQFLRTRGFDCKCFLMISYLQFFLWKVKKHWKPVQYVLILSTLSNRWRWSFFIVQETILFLRRQFGMIFSSPSSPSRTKEED